MSSPSFRALSPLKRARSRSMSPTLSSDDETPRKKARKQAARPTVKASASGAQWLASEAPEIDSSVLRSLDLNTDVGPAAKTCAVTNSRGSYVESAHLVPKDACSDMIEDLEFAWRVERNAIDVDDPRNLLPLTPELLQSFNAGRWALVLMDREIIGDLAGFATGDECASIKTICDVYKGKTLFPYGLLPLPGFEDEISRFGDSTSAPPVVHRYPYKDLPRLNLPILPHHAIIDLGIKLARLQKEDDARIFDWIRFTNIDMLPPFSLSKDIYALWQPTREFYDEYAPLPRVDRVLNRLIDPEDSFSCVSSEADHAYSDEDSDGDVGEDADSNLDENSDVKSGVESAPTETSFGPKEFQESHEHFVGRMIRWKYRVHRELEQDANPPSPSSVPLPPSPLSSPLPPPSPQHSST